MSRISIKICGLSTPETLDAALKGGASHVGFVHFAKSPRHVAVERLGQLVARVPGHVMKVGVVVNPDDATVDMLVGSGQLDALQLHGSEPPARLLAIRARFPALELWKAIPVKTAADIAGAAPYNQVADLVLFDAKTPDHADLPGGMGLRFDWSLLSEYRAPGPWGLSGGLDPANVPEAVRVTSAPLVDVSSGVESAPGIKDVDKIRAFCKAVQSL
ncbi:MAG: phosphoribosylanthranilate isomerase [Sphingobium sp.]|nr:phosphoribosylanthranilate isomerase [Sphingobium sp.]MBP6111467.1 phosphoribosylanthranilate isomerase [Sphingobium sp.]MBP8670121.1 phosphoribosylanthranilate isomerase [Sphingobium sp.]MBP9157374.1 phosphoribosylanthranilate isomerase [Sphingobium sp.]MCC6482939.1 phosphoribosylanthranilate isomerase [Sphingomonadaceae bacterium]